MRVAFENRDGMSYAIVHDHTGKFGPVQINIAGKNVTLGILAPTTVLGRNWSALPRIFASLFLNHPELLGTSKLLALARCVGSDVAFGDNYVWWPS